MKRTARCSCGKLGVDAEGEPGIVIACHCTECQRRTGSVFGVGAYYPKGKVKAAGPSKRYTRDGAEGRKMHNYFCTECGTNLVWESELVAGMIGIAVGAFLDPSFPAPARSVWEKNRHHWVRIGDEIPGHVQGRTSPAALR
jgi:hypothetical protein